MQCDYSCEQVGTPWTCAFSSLATNGGNITNAYVHCENVEFKLMNNSILVVRTGTDVSLSLHFATALHARVNICKLIKNIMCIASRDGVVPDFMIS